jgi:hypothetical protein
MHRAHRLLGIASLAFFACAAGIAPALAADPHILALGRELSEAFERGDTATLWKRMTPDMRRSVGSEADFAAQRDRVINYDGPETGVIREDTEVSGPNRIYRRIARRNIGQTPTLMEWTVDGEGRIVELVVRPQAIAIPSGKSNY